MTAVDSSRHLDTVLVKRNIRRFNKIVVMQVDG